MGKGTVFCARRPRTVAALALPTLEGSNHLALGKGKITLGDPSSAGEKRSSALGGPLQAQRGLSMFRREESLKQHNLKLDPESGGLYPGSANVQRAAAPEPGCDPALAGAAVISRP